MQNIFSNLQKLLLINHNVEFALIYIFSLLSINYTIFPYSNWVSVIYFHTVTEYILRDGGINLDLHAWIKKKIIYTILQDCKKVKTCHRSLMQNEFLGLHTVEIYMISALSPLYTNLQKYGQIMYTMNFSFSLYNMYQF